ncbi:MAG: hypothetical protein ACLRQ4_13495, partial [Neglectibacter timonensis]
LCLIPRIPAVEAARKVLPGRCLRAGGQDGGLGPSHLSRCKKDSVQAGGLLPSAVLNSFRRMKRRRDR